ncbi:MAG TPA: DUF6653 family protein [Propionibacteriaceae bacterium]|nr:DUF6653 family protein [Propionibacteriaceae bacterium]
MDGRGVVCRHWVRRDTRSGRPGRWRAGQEVPRWRRWNSGWRRCFGLEGDAAWQRHANPWSVYTRIPGPAALVAAIWTYTRLRWWSVIPVGVVCLWLAVNPRVFPPPRSVDHWASRAALGETFWAGRRTTPVPPRHRVAPNVLIGINCAGLPFIAWGLVARRGWIALFGLAVHMAGKIWFLDRMALLYDDMVSGRSDGAAPR